MFLIFVLAAMRCFSSQVRFQCGAVYHEFSVAVFFCTFLDSLLPFFVTTLSSFFDKNFFWRFQIGLVVLYYVKIGAARASIV